MIHHIHGLPGLQQGPGRGGGLPLQAGLHHLRQPPSGGRGRRSGPSAGDGGGHGGVSIGGDELPGVPVHVGQQVIAPHCRHHGIHIGVEDGQVQPRRHGHSEEILVHQGPGGQAEGDVGHPQHGFQPQLLLHPAQGSQRLGRPLLLGGDGEGQAVDVHILPPDAQGQRPLQDTAGHLHPGLRALGDAALVQGQAHHRRTVLFHQGQDGRQALLLPVDRVDNGLAAVDPQGPLQHLRVGGIQLEGGVGHSLERLHRADHHVCLVDLRQTHVHIQDVRPGLRLGQSLVEHIVHIPPAQGLLHQFLACGIDPLADDPHPVDGHCLSAAAHGGGDGPCDPAHRPALQLPPQQGDILRCGAAAAAEHLYPQVCQGGQAVGKLRRRDVIAGAVRVRQSGIGFQDDGQSGPPQQFLHQRGHLPGAQGAVHSDGVRPQPLQGQGGAGGGAAQEGAPRGLIGHGHQHRQAGVLSGRQQGGPGLLEVGHGLNGDQVRPCRRAGLHHLGKDVHRLFKLQGAGGLQQLADGAHVQGHQPPAPGRLPGHRDGGGDHLRHRPSAVGQLLPVGSEGIGIHDLGSGIQIGAVDLPQPLRVLQGGRLRRRPNGQAPGLEHGAHAAVQQDGSAGL